MNEAQEQMLLTMYRTRPEILNKEQREHAQFLKIHRNSDDSLTALQDCLNRNGCAVDQEQSQ